MEGIDDMVEEFNAADVEPEAMSEASAMLADGWDWEEVGEHISLVFGLDERDAYALAYLMREQD